MESLRVNYNFPIIDTQASKVFDRFNHFLCVIKFLVFLFRGSKKPTSC